MIDHDQFELMKVELQYLRAEMDLNRKYIFERPLLIVTAGITAAATLKGIHGFDLLPVAFSTLIGFNLWFTFNRLQSNSRIISYLQLVHTPSGFHRWIGWETALRLFRAWPVEHQREYAAISEIFRASGEIRENRFYGPILSFHMLAGLGLTAFLLAQVYPAGPAYSALPVAAFIALVFDVGAIAGLAIVAWVCRPARVRHTIATTRDIWDRALPGGAHDARFASTPNLPPAGAAETSARTAT